LNILAIGAHFDDIELGCGGTLIKHAKNGDKVHIIVLTDSEYGNYDGTLIRGKDTALKEGKAAAKIIGGSLKMGPFKTKQVIYGVALIEYLNEVIDSNNIDLVYTHWSHDMHQDHNAIGKATINAARHIPRVLMYRSNWYATDELFNKRFYSDISTELEKKIEAIKAHKSEYERRGDKWIDFVVNQNRNDGTEIGVEYAESFEVVKWII
jgi:N-acetylglucosamine malate deacetylase 1